MHRDVKKFMDVAGQTTNKFNPKQTSLYLGLCYEELEEALSAMYDIQFYASHTSMRLKRYEMPSIFENATQEQKVELLDAAIDLAWVAFGLAYSLGADVDGAVEEVTRMERLAAALNANKRDDFDAALQSLEKQAAF